MIRRFFSRENGDWGLAHPRGVDLYGSLAAGCDPRRIRGRAGSTSGGEAPVPCRDVSIVHRF